MKIVYSCLAIAVFLFLGSGCVEKSAEELYRDAQKAVGDSSTHAKAEKLFQKILTKHPEDQRCDDALFALAQIAVNRDQGEEAVEKYEQLLDQYPQSDMCYKAQFMIGFIYSEMLHDYPKASSAYQKVIESYSDCDLVDSAKWMIGNMGKGLEEMETFGSEQEKGAK